MEGDDEVKITGSVITDTKGKTLENQTSLILQKAIESASHDLIFRKKEVSKCLVIRKVMSKRYSRQCIN